MGVRCRWYTYDLHIQSEAPSNPQHDFGMGWPNRFDYHRLHHGCGCQFSELHSAMASDRCCVRHVSGTESNSFGVEKFLGSRPMVYLGGLSYGLYLWHWPILSFYYVIFDTTDVGVVH